MRKHYFAASGTRYRVRVEVIPQLEKNPRKDENPRIASLDFNIGIMDMLPGLTCGREWSVTKELKYSSHAYLRPELLTTKRCESYFFRKMNARTVNKWQQYTDYIVEQVLAREGQMSLFEDLGLPLQVEKSRLATTLKDSEIQLLVRKEILKHDNLFFKPVPA